MSSPPPTPSLPLPTVTTAPLAIYTAPLPPRPHCWSHPPAAAIAPPAAAYTPEEITGVLNDLVTAVQGILLYLATPYGPPPPLPSIVAIGPPTLPWYSPHPGASAAFAGMLLPQLQLSPAAAP